MQITVCIIVMAVGKQEGLSLWSSVYVKCACVSEISVAFALCGQLSHASSIVSHSQMAASLGLPRRPTLHSVVIWELWGNTSLPDSTFPATAIVTGMQNGREV